jgi:hypothetical protein
VHPTTRRPPKSFGDLCVWGSIIVGSLSLVNLVFFAVFLHWLYVRYVHEDVPLAVLSYVRSPSALINAADGTCASAI